MEDQMCVMCIDVPKNITAQQFAEQLEKLVEDFFETKPNFTYFADQKREAELANHLIQNF